MTWFLRSVICAPCRETVWASFASSPWEAGKSSERFTLSSSASTSSFPAATSTSADQLTSNRMPLGLVIFNSLLLLLLWWWWWWWWWWLLLFPFCFFFSFLSRSSCSFRRRQGDFGKRSRADVFASTAICSSWSQMKLLF